MPSLQTIFAGGNSQNGVMFNIIVGNSNIALNNFSIYPTSTNANQPINIYIYQGDVSSVLTNSAAWALIYTGTFSPPSSGQYDLGLSLNYVLTKNTTYGLYITVTGGTNIAYTNQASPAGTVYSSDSNLSICIGYGKSYPFGSSFSPRLWNGIITYSILNSCFLENTKILCYDGIQEVYRPIETLNKGDLVKTLNNGYLPIYKISSSTTYNHEDNSMEYKLYECNIEKFPELFQPLVITGNHSILVDNITDEQRKKLIDIVGDIYITNNKYRLLSCLDERVSLYENTNGPFTIWHIALENDNIYSNYGIYANGSLLVESCSIFDLD